MDQQAVNEQYTSPPLLQDANPAPGRSVLASFSWLGIGVLAGRLLQAILIIYLTRTIGDAALGRFSFVQTFVMYGIIVTDFRFWVVGTREVARDPTGLTLLSSNILLTRLILFAAEILLIVFGLPHLNVTGEMYWLFVFSFLSLLAYAINTDWIFRGFERMEYVAIWEALPRLIWLVGTLVFVHSPEDLLRVPLLRFAGEIVTTVVLLAVSWRRYPASRPTISAVRLGQIRSLMVQAAPLVAAALLVQMYYGFDVIVLTLVKSDAQAGQYRAVYTIATLLLMGSFLLDATYQPILARTFAADRDDFLRHLRRLAGAALLFGTTAPALVAIAAVPVVRILFGGTFAPAAGPLAILMASLPFAYLGMAYSAGLIAAGRQNRLMLASAVGALTNVAGNLVLVPYYGMNGAALAAVAGFATMCVLQWWYVYSTVCRIEPVPLRSVVDTIRKLPRVLRKIRR